MTHRKPLYTIGHSSLSTEQLLEYLRMHDISAVVDVRSQPYSRLYPHFSKPALRQSVLEAGLHYVYLGNELGARRSESECYVDGQAKYELIRRLPAFQEGISRVVYGASEETIGLLCAERDPLVCHRSILVCRELRSHKLDICHILNDGSLEPLEAVEIRLTEEEGLQPWQLGLLDHFDLEERIERAYDLRGEKIAYRAKDET